MELEGHGIELPADVLLPHLLARHDERPADVPVLDEAFTVRQAELLGEVQRSNTRCVGHGNDDVH